MKVENKMTIAAVRRTVRETLERLDEDFNATELVSSLRRAQDAIDFAKRVVKQSGSGQKLFKELDAIQDKIADISIGVHHMSGDVAARLEGSESRMALTESEVYFFRDANGRVKYRDDEGNEGNADSRAPIGHTLSASQASQYITTGLSKSDPWRSFGRGSRRRRW